MKLKTCPVCGNTHGCKKGDEGLILCLRGLTENFISGIPGYPLRGYRYIKPLKQNMGGLWVDETSVSQGYDSNPFKVQPERRAESSFEMRSDIELDREYRKLLSQLDLSTYHKNVLTKRGVSDATWTERVGFRSFVPRRPVENVLNVPGVIDGLTAGNNGMWIPIQTPWGLMIGAQCAPKRKDLGKYTYITGGTRVRENQGVLISYAYAFPKFAETRKYPVAHLSISMAHTSLETTVITCVTDSIGKTLKTASKVFKPFQNDTIAELNGLLLGLQLALSIGVKQLHISGVSESIRQVLKSDENDNRSQVLCNLVNELLDAQFEYAFNYTKPVLSGVTEESLLLGETFLDTREVWFVDGTAKAWYTAYKHHKIVLGCPMANHASNLADLTTYLEALAPEKCIHALDAGDVVNTSNVPATNYALQKALRKLNYQVLTAWWGQVEKVSGNDIDDLDNLDGIEYLTTSQFLDLHSPEIISKIEPSRFYKAGIQEVDEPYDYPRDIKYRQPSYFLEGYRTEILQGLIDQGYRFIHDASFAGSGKSRDFSSLEPEQFGVEQILWVVNDPISLEYPDWEYYRGRDHGRVQREDGRFIAAHPSTPYDELSLKGNCVENVFASHLAASNVPPSADRICLDCTFQHTCKSNPEFYLKARSKSIKAPKLRLHPAALDVNLMKTSDGKKWDLDSEMEAMRVLILDDVSHWVKTTNVKSSEIKAFLARHEEALKLLPALRNALVTMRFLLSKRDANKKRLNLQHNEIIGNFRSLKDLDQAQVDLLIEAEYASIRDAFKELEEVKNSGDYDEAQSVTLPKAFIEDFINAVSHDGHLNTYNGSLTIHLKNDRYIAAVNHPSVKSVIFADATAKTEHLEQWLQLDVQIPVIAQQIPEETAKLTITQIVGLGDVGYTRSDRVKAEVAKVQTYIEENHKDYAFINTKKGLSEREGGDALELTWLSTSRGSNAAKDAKGLVCVGTPRANLAALYAKYALMTGHHPEEKSTLTPYPVNYSNRQGDWVRVLKESADPAFAEFCHQEVTAELTQGFNRLRHARRAGEVLDIIFISEYPLEAATRALTVSEFIEGYQAPKLKVRANQSKVDQDEIMEAVGILRNLKFRITKRALALICEVTEGTIRSFFEKVGLDWKQFKADCESAETLTVHTKWETTESLTSNSTENNNNKIIDTSPIIPTYLEPYTFQRFSNGSEMDYETPDALTSVVDLENSQSTVFEFEF